MSRLLEWGAIHISRRKFLRRTAVGVFGVAAGMAAGVPHSVAEAPCTPPNGVSRCSSCLCYANGHCKSGCGAVCQEHPGASCGCWTALGGGLCCDCDCRSGSFYWSCFCSS